MATTSSPTDRAGVSVELEKFSLTAGGATLLNDAAARFEAGQTTLIVGCSGVGKSLLLRAIAGLLDADHRAVQAKGRLLVGGKAVSLSSQRGAIGVVFQQFALFDELSALNNVRIAHAHRANRRRGASAPVELLEELSVPRSVPVSAMSGGQRQRLAIARALAFDPDVMLYDEPTSGLDVATAEQVARLIEKTHTLHPKTAIVVTHDYEALAPIADRIYLLDAETYSLRAIPRENWDKLRDELKPPSVSESSGPKTVGAKAKSLAGAAMGKFSSFFVATSRVVEETLLSPLRLLPIWRRPFWGARFFLHYLHLVAGPSAWIYLGVAGAILGYVTTHFTFKFLPYANYTEPLLIENLLSSMGFALFRILAPILATLLIAARCGAAVASDVGGKTYSHQIDAMKSLRIPPTRYLLTGILYAFLIGAPILATFCYVVASGTSLLVFSASHPDRGPMFWEQHFHRLLRLPSQPLFDGTIWMLFKTLVCAAGMALISYHLGARRKDSSSDVSRSVTSTILWSTLFVLVVHFVFAFYEFEA